jgi:hypothetical protein
MDSDCPTLFSVYKDFSKQANLNVSDSDINVLLQKVTRSGKPYGGKSRKMKGGAPCTWQGLAAILTIFMALSVGGTTAVYCILPQLTAGLGSALKEAIMSNIKGVISAITASIQMRNPAIAQAAWNSLKGLMEGIGIDKVLGLGTEEQSILLNMLHAGCKQLGMTIPPQTGGKRKSKKSKKTRKTRK